MPKSDNPESYDPARIKILAGLATESKASLLQMELVSGEQLESVQASGSNAAVRDY